MNRKEFQKAYGKLVAKAWEDEDFKTRLLDEPMTVFKENGIEIPEGLDVRVVENTDAVVNLILPPQPEGELTDEQLDGGSVAGRSWRAFVGYYLDVKRRDS